MDSGFLEVLHADGPAADRAEKMALYGQFIGSWDTDIVTHEQNGVEHRGNGEIHFGWVLEGRASACGAASRLSLCCLSPATGTAPRFVSTIPALMPGTSCGPIRPIKSTRNRLDGREARTSAGRRDLALELYGNHRQFVPLARRAFSR